MRNNFWLNIIVIAVIVVSAGSASGKQKNGECTYPTHTMIVDALRPGVGLTQAIRYLRVKEIGFGLAAEDNREVDVSDFLRGNNIRRLGSPAIVIATKNPKNKGLITGGELLNMKFDKRLRLVNTECKKYYTGP